MVLDEFFVGYLEKLHKYQVLLRRQKILDHRYQQKVKEYHEAVNIVRYLEKNSYLVDPLLAEYVSKREKLVQEWTSVFNDINQLRNEIHPGNFRHVVYSLTNEIGLSLEKLAEKLNCSHKNVLAVLCESGCINKSDYQNVCTHFGLDEDLWEYHYVYPKTEHAIPSNSCG